MKPFAILATLALVAGSTVTAGAQEERHNRPPRPDRPVPLPQPVPNRPVPLPGPVGWTTIGYTTVGAGRDRDVIRVRGNARHRQLRVCAINRAIDMRDLDVVFANGGHQDIRVRQTIRAGTCTAAKDLQGRNRNMQSVAIVYSRLRGVMPVVRIQAR